MLTYILCEPEVVFNDFIHLFIHSLIYNLSFILVIQSRNRSAFDVYSWNHWPEKLSDEHTAP